MSVPAPTTLGLAASFGFGDRTGLATPGHIAALRQAGKSIKPIFAQQSIREMTRTQRTPTQVMGDAIGAMEKAGYTSQHGADADHLKVPEDVDRTAAAGFTFFTIDPSDDVDPKTDDYSFSELQERFAAEPVYARTGKGFLKSEGVAELQRLKAAEAQPVAPTSAS